MLATLVQDTFLSAVCGEITEDEAADKIADALCAANPAYSGQINSQTQDNGFQFQQVADGDLKKDISIKQQNKQTKILGTMTLGDLHPDQITQIQQAFAEANKGLASSVVFNVPLPKKFDDEDNFSNDDKERCALLNELITGQRPIILHPYVFLLNRRFKWTDIAVPVSGTDRFRIYRLNQARNARCYYRCSGCETLAKEPGDPIAQIKLAEGHLAGDVNPVHHAKCELFSFSCIVNRQFDREARLDVYNGIMTPKDAWNRGRLRALRAEDLAPKGLVNSDEYPTWETMNKVIMKLWRSAKRAHDAGVELGDRVGSKDWWRNIPPPHAARRGVKRENIGVVNYDLRHPRIQHESGEVDEYEDDDDRSCISMASSGGGGYVEVLDVVSESEIYTTDREPSPPARSGRQTVAPEPPEQISLFTNDLSNAGSFKPSLRQDRNDASATLSEKAEDVFVRSGEENDDVQYYLVQGEDDDEDDDDEDDEDEENDVDVDNDDNINIDNGDEDDEVMREYRDILTEVQQLEREATAATGRDNRLEHGRKMSDVCSRGFPAEQSSQRSHSYSATRGRSDRNRVSMNTANANISTMQPFVATEFANRKLFSAIESLTRTLNANHSRQFHQEMLKMAVELSNHYAAQQQQQFAAAAAAAERLNATVERRSVPVPERLSDDDDDEKSFGKVIGRRQAVGTPLRTWALKRGTRIE